MEFALLESTQNVNLFNLLQAMELGEFTKDEVLDRLNNLKRLRTEGEANLNALTKARDNITGLANASIRLNQIYDQVFKRTWRIAPRS